MQSNTVKAATTDTLNPTADSKMWPTTHNHVISFDCPTAQIENLANQSRCDNRLIMTILLGTSPLTRKHKLGLVIRALRLDYTENSSTQNKTEHSILPCHSINHQSRGPKSMMYVFDVRECSCGPMQRDISHTSSASSLAASAKWGFGNSCILHGLCFLEWWSPTSCGFQPYLDLGESTD